MPNLQEPARWVEIVSNIRGDGVVCSNCNYFIPFGETILDKCPCCRKPMKLDIDKLTLLEGLNETTD